MGSLTIGAKYKTTIKDPGTAGILLMVRATLPSPFSPTPRGSISPPSPPGARARFASWLRGVPLLLARVLVGGFWGARQIESRARWRLAADWIGGGGGARGFVLISGSKS